MAKDKAKARIDIELGPMPVEVVNFTLELEIEPGIVILSRGTQVHAERNHPKDYDRCLKYVPSIIADPLYLGDDFRNHGKIEFIGRAGGGPVLVAISLSVDENGCYHVHSFYPISETKVNSRRAKGFLKVAQKKTGP